jgi:molybdopterin/thiamine biosynthesis adenylyltransferase/rhodanese-related sulfurtransferase
MSLTDQEKNRYSRHILLDKVGLEGQEKLKAAKVLVIGAGGLGCPVLQYLTAAGVGTIGIIDFDRVDATNLQRQILYTVGDIGQNKAITAKNRLTQLNPHVNFRVYPEKLTTKNALELFLKYDIVVDGTDNFSTRYLVNDACVITNKPLVYGAIFKFEGQVSVFNYKNGPTYRCLFPEPPKAGSVPNCSDVGVIGVLPGLIGTQQANEVIKLILEIGAPLSGKLLTYDSLNNSFLTLKVTRSEEETQKVLSNSDDFENIDYDLFCGISMENDIKEITQKDLKSMLDGSEDFQIVDVRGEWEQPRIDISTSLNGQLLIAPLNDLGSYVDQISKNKKVIVVCQHGIRSVAAIEHLESEYDFKNLINLENGIGS